MAHVLKLVTEIEFKDAAALDHYIKEHMPIDFEDKLKLLKDFSLSQRKDGLELAMIGADEEVPGAVSMNHLYTLEGSKK